MVDRLIFDRCSCCSWIWEPCSCYCWAWEHISCYCWCLDYCCCCCCNLRSCSCYCWILVGCKLDSEAPREKKLTPKQLHCICSGYLLQKRSYSWLGEGLVGAYVVCEYCGSICPQVSWHRHETSLGLPTARLELVEIVCCAG